MTIEEIIQRNYNATVKRGKIKPTTTQDEFVAKMKEELNEFEIETELPFMGNEDEELADIILVCLSYANHFELDILKAMEQKVIFNEQRKD